MTVNLPFTADVVVMADRTRLRQLFLNLVTNAIKYGAGTPIGVELVRATPSEVWLRVLDGGMLAWEAAGLPTSAIQADTLPWTIERQVRLVAGLLVAVSIAASVIWPPARFLAGAVGLGLVFAAVTNTCTMGALLARLPYNRRAVSCDLPTVVSALTGPTSEVKS